MWWGDWYPVSRRMLEVSKRSKRQVTMHLHLEGEPETFCEGSVARYESFGFHRNRSWRTWTTAYGRIYPQWEVPESPPPFNRVLQHSKDAGKVQLCLKCAQATEPLRERLTLLAVTATARPEPTPASTLRDPLKAPKRPPGTEEMTGHLDEGSVGGACGTAGQGFKTTYVPWVTCPECLVHLDLWTEAGALRLDGYYVEPTP